jgi:hypothetical protein
VLAILFGYHASQHNRNCRMFLCVVLAPYWVVPQFDYGGERASC